MMKTIIITGGNFINKGAEAMLMATVAGIEEHFSGYEAVVLDLFPTLNYSQKKKFSFRILNMHVRSLFRISFPWIKVFFRGKAISDAEEEIKAAFSGASALFDISGYGLSSHNQPLMWSTAYLLPIRLAKKHRVPVYLLPQSFGPFQFTGLKKVLFSLWGKALLNYPVAAFAREPAGLQALKQVRKPATYLFPDIVLQSPATYSPPAVSDEARPPNAVVIPNRQLFNLAPKEVVMSIYMQAIEQLLEEGFVVSVIRHSSDDLQFCMDIDDLKKDVKLHVHSNNYSLNELNGFIAEARVVVSGRYHGAIHALKQHKPVLIVGWADKYQHLASLFGIEKYLIDLRKPVEITEIRGLVAALVSEAGTLTHLLKSKLQQINQHSFWQHIDLES